MGGDVSIDKARSELKRIANSFDYVTTFYDFYGFKGKVAADSKASLEARLKDAVHEQVRSKLSPYVQMYEFEGILFSCPEAVEVGLNEQGTQQWAQAILDEFHGDPEQINNSVDTAPSKRLIKQTGYRKTTHGPNIVKEIGVDKIRSKGRSSKKHPVMVC